MQWHLEPAAPEEGNLFNLKPGSILLQMARPTGQRDANGNATYDWKNKACFKLTADELSNIIMVLHERREKATFVHDPAKSGSENGGMKNLFVEWKTYKKAGADVRGVLMTINHNQSSISVGLSENEIFTLPALIAAAIPRIYGW